MLISCIIISILIIDQLTKLIVLQNLQPGESFVVIKNIFHISLVFNKGIAFGIFSGINSIFIGISFIVTIILLIFLFLKRFFRQENSGQIFFGLIVSGAIGNFIDRIRLGYVVDFLDFRIWPVFNVADAAITIGTVLLILQILKGKARKT